jgi:RNA polymerase sigma factor (sigma-70 family)
MGINFGIDQPNDTTMQTDNYLQLIYEGCLRNEAKYQERLYKLLAPKMLGVCMRYAKDKDEAQDIMQEGFIKIFRHLHSFRNEGSLEGWIRHIMVNTSINRYRKAKNTVLVDDISENDTLNSGGYNNDSLEAADLMNMIQQLPGNYRNVFNMYAIEGYSHQEIGNELGISELLSRATLHRARGILKNKLVALQSREMVYMAG